jgi:hypothetical protein
MSVQLPSPMAAVVEGKQSPMSREWRQFFESVVKRIDAIEQSLTAPSMTTAERDALTATNGMVIYNTTTNRAEAYENGSWVDL